MAWVAVDRAIRSVQEFDLDGPIEDWLQLRDAIRADILGRGYDRRRRTFTQFYGSEALDAALLMIPLVGFLPADDERVLGTLAAIESDLLVDGFVRRYSQHSPDGADGLPPGEGAFLACTFWLADNYALVGRAAEAEEIFERLLQLRNDVGLLAEEYDTNAKRLVGNFPQAFSHFPLVNSARNLSAGNGPTHRRAGIDGADGPGARRS
jgi:GH15 family glucan-1,4-alpha-glucosidase